MFFAPTFYCSSVCKGSTIKTFLRTFINSAMSIAFNVIFVNPVKTINFDAELIISSIFYCVGCHTSA